MRLFEGTPLDRPPRCEKCEELESECTCPAPIVEWKTPSQQTARLSVEKRKKGKSVTVVRGLAPHESNLPELLTQLKSACGAGGSIHEDRLEVQGNQLVRIRELLRSIGYRIKG